MITTMTVLIYHIIYQIDCESDKPESDYQNIGVKGKNDNNDGTVFDRYSDDEAEHDRGIPSSYIERGPVHHV